MTLKQYEDKFKKISGLVKLPIATERMLFLNYMRMRLGLSPIDKTIKSVSVKRSEIDPTLSWRERHR